MSYSKYKLTILATVATLLTVSLSAALVPGTSLAVVPENGKCPKGYYIRDQDNTCVKQSTADQQSGSNSNSSAVPGGSDRCGGDSNGGATDDSVYTAINFGCTGKGNAIIDLTFAIIRFLSNGVGLVVVGSIVFAGIQYTASRADPQATAMAQKRIQSSLIALMIYIFAYAILNYVIPKGFLHQ